MCAPQPLPPPSSSLSFSMSLVTPTAGVRSAGRAFRQVIAVAGTGANRQPAQLLGAVNPYCAMLAEKAGQCGKARTHSAAGRAAK